MLSCRLGGYHYCINNVCKRGQLEQSFLFGESSASAIDDGPSTLALHHELAVLSDAKMPQPKRHHPLAVTTEFLHTLVMQAVRNPSEARARENKIMEAMHACRSALRETRKRAMDQHCMSRRACIFADIETPEGVARQANLLT